MSWAKFVVVGHSCGMAWQHTKDGYKPCFFASSLQTAKSFQSCYGGSITPYVSGSN